MIMDTLITDRTLADLENDTDRAYIDFKDLNRVEEACKYLANIFNVNISTKEWVMEDFRTQSEMDRLLHNIKLVRKAYFTKANTPATPSKITYESIYQANDIEKILKDLNDMYESMLSGIKKLSFKLGSRALGNRLER